MSMKLLTSAYLFPLLRCFFYWNAVVTWSRENIFSCT